MKDAWPWVIAVLFALVVGFFAGWYFGVPDAPAGLLAVAGTAMGLLGGIAGTYYTTRSQERTTHAQRVFEYKQRRIDRMEEALGGFLSMTSRFIAKWCNHAQHPKPGNPDVPGHAERAENRSRVSVSCRADITEAVASYAQTVTKFAEELRESLGNRAPLTYEQITGIKKRRVDGERTNLMKKIEKYLADERDELLQPPA